jgi:putative tryptophan/tyrosine transport system substrate-binding protein
VRRRAFIAGLGAAAWPLAARAQQNERLPVVGFLNATDFDYHVAAFLQGLKEFGYFENQNVVIDYRWAEGHYDRLTAMAADLVRRRVAVIVTGGGTPAFLAAKVATATIPIVFTTGTDPVGDGFVDTLNRPNANVTGIGFLVASLRPKQFEMLHQAVPNASTVGYLINSTDTSSAKTMGEVQAAADVLGLKLVVSNASSDGEFEGAFANLVQNQVGGLVVSGDAFFNNRRHLLVELAARYSVPTIYSYREYTIAGGLMSYGTSIAEAYRLAGTYAGRILKGEKTIDLPVQQSTRVELIVNLKATKALGLTIPETLLATADEVIQ